MHGVLIDLDGVLREGARVVPGTPQAINWLRTRDIPRLFRVIGVGGIIGVRVKTETIIGVRVKTIPCNLSFATHIYCGE